MRQHNVLSEFENLLIPSHLQDSINTYVQLLKTYNTHTNIYSEKAYDRLPFHIQDSMTLAGLITNTHKTVLDIGSGCGFPAVLIALTNPLNTVIAVESKSRKTAFLNQIVASLKLNNLTIIQKDIHEFIREKQVLPHVLTAKAFGSIDKIMGIAKKINRSGMEIFVPISAAQSEYIKDNILKKEPYFYFFKRKP